MTDPTPPKPSAARRFYDWTIHWAETRHALPALLLVSFSSSIFFPIPPDVLLISMTFARPSRWFFYALLCAVASVAGGVAAWMIGAWFWQIAGPFFFHFVPGFSPVKFASLEKLFQQYGFLIVMAKNLTPIPYKVVAIASGVFQMNILQLALASFLSRGVRYLLTSGLIRVFGPRIRPHLEKNIDLAILLFALSLILGFVLLKFL